MKASVSALQSSPSSTRSLSPEKDALILKKYYHIGVAVDTPDGLVVPVIRDVDRKGIARAQPGTGRASKKARDGKLAPADMQGALHDLEPRRHRRHRLHADRQRAGGGDPRRGALEDGAGLERQGVRAAADAAALAVLRPPRHRRRARPPASPAISATSWRTSAGWSCDRADAVARRPESSHEHDRNPRSRHRRLQGRPDHRGPRQARRHGRGRRPAASTLESDKATHGGAGARRPARSARSRSRSATRSRKAT